MISLSVIIRSIKKVAVIVSILQYIISNIRVAIGHGTHFLLSNYPRLYIMKAGGKIMDEHFGYSVPAGSFLDLKEEQSSLIDTITLMGDGTMDVVFRSTPDVTYTYSDVPPAVWNRILQGSPAKDGTLWSIGAAFHKYVVKKPQLYPFIKRNTRGE